MKSKRKIKKKIIFLILTMATGVVYKLPYIQDVFYVSIQESLNLSHTQLGNILSMAGLFSTFGFLLSIYFIDRIFKRILIPCALIGVGFTGIYLYTLPSYYGLMFIWVLFALFSDMVYWPVLVKSVKELGNDDEQGRIFGFFEAGRGLFDTLIVFIALSIFSIYGSIKYVILFYSITCILMGVLAFILLDKDEKVNAKENKKKMSFPIEVIKVKEVWLISGNIFCAYAIYCGLTYMMPFLQNTFGIGVVVIGIYGTVNQYGIKMMAGPLGGYLADKKFKSTSRYFCFCFKLIIIANVIMILLAKSKISIIVGFVFVIVFSILVNSMKALLFAPMQEAGISEELSGAAISLSSFIGYSPLIFCYSLYGSILDKFNGLLGYRILFLILIVFGIIGLIINKKLREITVTNKLNEDKKVS